MAENTADFFPYVSGGRECEMRFMDSSRGVDKASFLLEALGEGRSLAFSRFSKPLEFPGCGLSLHLQRTSLRALLPS